VFGCRAQEARGGGQARCPVVSMAAHAHAVLGRLKVKVIGHQGHRRGQLGQGQMMGLAGGGVGASQRGRKVSLVGVLHHFHYRVYMYKTQTLTFLLKWNLNCLFNKNVIWNQDFSVFSIISFSVSERPVFIYNKTFWYKGNNSLSSRWQVDTCITWVDGRVSACRPVHV